MEVNARPLELMNEVAINMIKKSHEMDERQVLPIFNDVDENIRELVAIFLQKGQNLDIIA